LIEKSKFLIHLFFFYKDVISSLDTTVKEDLLQTSVNRTKRQVLSRPLRGTLAYTTQFAINSGQYSTNNGLAPLPENKFVTPGYIT
jgi:hypothetical protein